MVKPTKVTNSIRALREGAIVGLANHTILVSRDGSEAPIDDSAAPVRAAGGRVAGSVLVTTADVRLAEPESDLETALGDGAAAALVGRDGVIAELVA